SDVSPCLLADSQPVEPGHQLVLLRKPAELPARDERREVDAVGSRAIGLRPRELHGPLGDRGHRLVRRSPPTRFGRILIALPIVRLERDPGPVSGPLDSVTEGHPALLGEVGEDAPLLAAAVAEVAVFANAELRRAIPLERARSTVLAIAAHELDPELLQDFGK